MKTVDDIIKECTVNNKLIVTEAYEKCMHEGIKISGTDFIKKVSVLPVQVVCDVRKIIKMTKQKVWWKHESEN